MNEFELIKQFFATPNKSDPRVVLGVGDDAAVLDVPSDQRLVSTTDTLVENVHFFDDAPPAFLGHKSIAVSLSDLAAMGAEPAWVQLALTLPVADEGWLTDFSDSFFKLCEEHGLSLIGGDTTQGPLSITVQAFGLLPKNVAPLTRRGANVGDLIVVSGRLGGSSLGLKHLNGEIELDEEEERLCLKKHFYPIPQLALGRALRGVASAAIDISDGFLADLSHILNQSEVGAVLEASCIPAVNDAMEDALTGGEDYELCFTVPPSKRADLDALSQTFTLTKVGEITAQPGLVLITPEGEKKNVTARGYQHFGGKYDTSAISG